jgi:hypothetical protein
VRHLTLDLIKKLLKQKNSLELWCSSVPEGEKFIQRVSTDGFREFQSAIIFQTGDTCPEKKKLKITLLLINGSIEKDTVYTQPSSYVVVTGWSETHFC